jgi:hypothetical protein
MLFLIRMCVVAVLPAQNNRPRKPRMSEFPVRTFAAGHSNKACGFQVGDQLAELSRHDAALALYSHEPSRRVKPEWRIGKL